MKNILLTPILIFSILLTAAQKPENQVKSTTSPIISTENIPDIADRNNNFYDNGETYNLPLHDLFIGGEIENPGFVDFTKLAKHSVIVKEALLTGDSGNRFVGAYRYDGYSLFDILCDRILKKNNALEFRPVIDVYVEIENGRNDKVVLSWGEIFYPNVLHNTIIATEVMRIVPSKTRDLWPLPAESKLVVGHDLVSERNISGPVKIIVKSYSGTYRVNRDINPLFSYKFDLVINEKRVDSLTAVPPGLQIGTRQAIFYGRGRGIHSTQPFSGIYLNDYLVQKLRISRENLRSGLVVCAGIDGYRAVYSLSEIMNRSDHSEVLLVPCPEEKDGGKFRIFPSCDFFSDRAVKALSEIVIQKIVN